MVGFILANIIGVTIILLSIQFYRDIKPIFSNNDSFMSQNYIVATKKVSTLGSISNKSNLFTKSEIQELQNQEFCNHLGVFTPSLFKVYAGLSIESKGIRFGTDLFFESVPNEFIDVSLENWSFNSLDDNKVIPIILPRNYLNLYNFGFAESRNLPKLSEGMVGMVQLDVHLTGNGRKEVLKGNVIGFSNRINTILVPQQFMDWANETFSAEKQKNPSRIIIEVDQPANPAITEYFQSKGYEAESGALDDSKTTYFLKVLIGLVLFIGLLISLLSLYILLLSIFLLIQKSTDKIRNLQLLGYTSRQIALPYQLLMIITNSISFVISIVFMYCLRAYYIQEVRPLIPSLSSDFPTSIIILASTLLILVVVVNGILIKRQIIKTE